MQLNNEGDPAFKTDTEPKPQFTGVFIDDQRGFCKAYTRYFKDIPSFRSIIIEPPESEECYPDLKETQLGTAFSSINPGEVSLLMVDQSVLIDPTKEFIKKVRSSNPGAWILEISVDVRRKITPESNNAVDKHDLLNILQHKIDFLPISAARFDRFKYETSQAFSQAGMADHRDQDPGFQDDFLSRRSKDMAEKHLNYSQALALMGIDPENFNNQFQKSKKQEKILHGLWSVIGHLEMGHPPEFYGLPLARLKTLLKE